MEIVNHIGSVGSQKSSSICFPVEYNCCGVNSTLPNKFSPLVGKSKSPNSISGYCPLLDLNSYVRTQKHKSARQITNIEQQELKFLFQVKELFGYLPFPRSCECEETWDGNITKRQGIVSTSRNPVVNNSSNIKGIQKDLHSYGCIYLKRHMNYLVVPKLVKALRDNKVREERLTVCSPVIT